MRQPRFSLVPVSNGHELHTTLWGEASNPAIVMWHGLARTGRDFDELAHALSSDYFVICPDTIGRGLSSWATDPVAEYCLSFYSAIALDLLNFFEIDHAGWVGTSMGGLIGMRLASGANSDRLNWLIINDIGPEVPQEAIDRIITYAGESPKFNNLSGAEKWLREVYVPFGPAPDEFWRRMARTSVRRVNDGSLTTHYDPKIIVQFSASENDFQNWRDFEKITLPTQIVWGQRSDLLTFPILERMCAIGPKPEVSVFENCGHAPTLSNPADIDKVRRIIDMLESSSSLTKRH